MKVSTKPIFNRRTLLTAGAGLAALGLTAGKRSSLDTPSVLAKESVSLYSYSPERSLSLLPLDIMTLEDGLVEESIHLGEGEKDSVVVSQHARIVGKVKNNYAIVLDRDTGIERPLAIEPSLWPVAISPNGSRLVVQRWDQSIADSSMTWNVVNTKTGEVELIIGPFSVWSQATIDESVVRLSYLSTQAQDEGEPNGPRQASLAVHDLVHGSEIGRVEIPGVLAGNWPTGRYFGEGTGEEIMGFQTPGLAFSPDRKRYAVVHPDGSVITMINSLTLDIERQIEVTKPKGILNKIASFLQIAPQSAAAKAGEGTDRSAVFSRDGESLYVWGNVASADEELMWTGVGLQRIDISTGEIVAIALDGRQIDRVLPLSDTLLVTSFSLQDPTENSSEPNFSLRRLDSMSLSIEADRGYPERRSFVPVRW